MIQLVLQFVKNTFIKQILKLFSTPNFCVCRYDYSGYGQSSGKVTAFSTLFWLILIFFISIAQSNAYLDICWQPSEHNTYADIEAAYKYLGENFGAKQEDVILYGQSVGSGPTLDLATRLPLLRAVVLHSPILSGLRVMYPVKRTYWFDIYKVRSSTLFFMLGAKWRDNSVILLLCI